MFGQAFIRTIVQVIRRIKPFIRKSNEVIRTWMNFEDAFEFFSMFKAEKNVRTVYIRTLVRDIRKYHKDI